MRISYLIVPLLVSIAFPSLTYAQTIDYKIGSTGFPSTIRVAIRENNAFGEPDPRGRIIYVTTVNFDQYCRDVLPNEWFPTWHLAALEAGAIAIKMFGWYHHLHPVTVDGFTFDVDNTVNFQLYRALSDQEKTDFAYQNTRNLAYVKPDQTIFELNYRAGYENNPNWQYRNAQKMSQWGSQYWANLGKTPLEILNFYYQNRALTTIPNVGRG